MASWPENLENVQIFSSAGFVWSFFSLCKRSPFGVSNFSPSEHSHVGLLFTSERVCTCMCACMHECVCMWACLKHMLLLRTFFLCMCVCVCEYVHACLKHMLLLNTFFFCICVCVYIYVCMCMCEITFSMHDALCFVVLLPWNEFHLSVTVSKVVLCCAVALDRCYIFTGSGCGVREICSVLIPVVTIMLDRSHIFTGNRHRAKEI